VFGVVTVPGGWRYHPAIVVLSAATLDEMFPGRFWMAPGSGEALNEHIVGRPWPDKAERNARLLESVEIMRALWSGETVTHRGRIRVEEARLYTGTGRPIRVVGAALSPETARWMGGWADGLITIWARGDELREILDAFREGGGEAKPVFLQAQLAFGRDRERTLREAWTQWRSAQFPSAVLATLRTPTEFDAAAETIRPEDFERRVRASDEWERHLEWLARAAEFGFEEINIHNIPRTGQDRFIDVFGERVLPELRRLRGG
jgi:coenzyme F420-dependent glucose-6-phosphate dehydrogenase